MTRLALLCPGQGSQHRGMFDMLRDDANAAASMAQWNLDELLGAPLDYLLSQEKLLYANRHAQPLIVAATLAAWEGLRSLLPAPALVAGYSVGELAAYGVAGAIDCCDVIDLATARARLMDECAGRTPAQAMLAVSGVPVHGALLDSLPLSIAIETGDDSAIAGCLHADLLAIDSCVRQAGGRVCRLPVEVASHTPWMESAAQSFEAMLRHSRFADPAVPVLAGISAERVTRRDDAIALLSRQVAETIRWADCMDAMVEAGIDIALELGPGSSLSRMLAARHPHIRCRSVFEFRSLEGAARWVERAAG